MSLENNKSEGHWVDIVTEEICVMHVYKYNIFTIYNVPAIYVFRADFLILDNSLFLWSSVG